MKTVAGATRLQASAVLCAVSITGRGNTIFSSLKNIVAFVHVALRLSTQSNCNLTAIYTHVLFFDANEMLTSVKNDKAAAIRSGLIVHDQLPLMVS
ncbi:hypothetical protein DN068_02120 [Taibaiella soli]|uniref:Uncharacterized protein n=1 Tax=Taibaiella soli TaxID=1649169 RepID=A0A2W2B2X1_9BACT|nr:hypothetical protein DN068_02120 [Taibaiella soli]